MRLEERLSDSCPRVMSSEELPLSSIIVVKYQVNSVINLVHEHMKVLVFQPGSASVIRDGDVSSTLLQQFEGRVKHVDK
jgi:hypothetical protein